MPEIAEQVAEWKALVQRRRAASGQDLELLDAMESAVELCECLAERCQSAEPNTGCFEGLLVKRGETRKTWKLRCFRLQKEERRLDYHEPAAGKGALKGSIALAEIEAVRPSAGCAPQAELHKLLAAAGMRPGDAGSWTYGFEIVLPRRTYHVAAERLEDQIRWIDEIKAAAGLQDTPHGSLCGQLVKLSGTLRVWKRRYFVLNSELSRLDYYDAGGGGAVRGTFQLSDVTDVSEVPSLSEDDRRRVAAAAGCSDDELWAYALELTLARAGIVRLVAETHTDRQLWIERLLAQMHGELEITLWQGVDIPDDSGCGFRVAAWLSLSEASGGCPSKEPPDAAVFDTEPGCPDWNFSFSTTPPANMADMGLSVCLRAYGVVVASATVAVTQLLEDAAADRPPRSVKLRPNGAVLATAAFTKACSVAGGAGRGS
eukprot:TRINITY_DN2763_c0_g1_i1.p1 TRINITY_DN2763_c0_g1~~TRINITY_DN2763_c0_g1_i1.p1  ORF type:complete len:477 (+),score=101.95 TRINITY_DN2763_c0_g1_i1:144-1433(+)